MIGLRGRAGVTGRIDLHRRIATIGVSVRPTSAVEWDLHYMLTLSAAILLSRIGRALVHAAAVVGPAGGAWLLVGDTHVGKTTTAVNLIEAGWGFISDDQVILSPAEAAKPPGVEGWLRPFHLDSGWASGSPGGERLDFDPGQLGGGRHRSRAPVAGLLFPRVVANQPTTIKPLSGGKALSLLIRQSPWLFLDREGAPQVLRLLTGVAQGPTYRLRLGLDTYRDGDRLLGILSPAVESRTR